MALLCFPPETRGWRTQAPSPPSPPKHLSERWRKPNFHTTCPRAVAGMGGHGPQLRARRTTLPRGASAAHPSPWASLSGCRGRNALGSCKDKIKSLLGVSRQRSRKRDSTVCFLGGLFGFYFFKFYFIFGSCDDSGEGVNGLARARMHLWLSRGRSGRSLRVSAPRRA